MCIFDLLNSFSCFLPANNANKCEKKISLSTAVIISRRGAKHTEETLGCLFNLHIWQMENISVKHKITETRIYIYLVA